MNGNLTQQNYYTMVDLKEGNNYHKLIKLITMAEENEFKYIKGNTDLLSENLLGKKVLLLGSGPSAREIDWKSEDWDVLVTTSFFYLNDDILEQKPIHVTLTDLVDLEKPKLIEYLDSNPKCTIAFEPKLHPFYQSPDFHEFTKKYEDRLIYYVILGGKEGVAARLCWLTLACEPEKLYICGIDGISKNWEDDPQNYFRDHKGTGDMGKTGYSYKVYWNDFQNFGKKLYATSKEMGISLINLGKGKPYNMITNISEEYE